MVSNPAQGKVKLIGVLGYKATTSTLPELLDAKLFAKTAAFGQLLQRTPVTSNNNTFFTEAAGTEPM
jgi:hypothetical protein